MTRAGTQILQAVNESTMKATASPIFFKKTFKKWPSATLDAIYVLV